MEASYSETVGRVTAPSFLDSASWFIRYVIAVHYAERMNIRSRSRRQSFGWLCNAGSMLKAACRNTMKQHKSQA